MAAKARSNGSSSTGNGKRSASVKNTASIEVFGTDRRKGRAHPPPRTVERPRKSANDVMLEAWEYTYKTRERRLTKP